MFYEIRGPSVPAEDDPLGESRLVGADQRDAGEDERAAGELPAGRHLAKGCPGDRRDEQDSGIPALVFGLELGRAGCRAWPDGRVVRGAACLVLRGGPLAWRPSVAKDCRIVRGPRWRAWSAGRPARAARRLRVRRTSAANSRLPVRVANSAWSPAGPARPAR